MTRLPIKLLLAAASGVACEFIYIKTGGEPGGFLFSAQGWVTIILPGALFAGTVLFPYLKRDSQVYWRAAALVLLSATSYWTAVQVVLLNAGAYGTSWDAFILASLAGAAIVLIGAIFLVPIRASVAFFLSGFVAAVAGGLLFDMEKEIPTPYMHFAIWHVSIALAIHVGSPSTEVGARFSNWLMPRFNKLVLAFVAVLAIPYVDHAVAYVVFVAHDRLFPDSTINERVEVPGLLIPGLGWSCRHEVPEFLGKGYAYVEVEWGQWESERCPYSSAPGYQHFFLSTNDDPRCRAFIAHEYPDALRERFNLGADQCIAAANTPAPISEYEWRRRTESTSTLFGAYQFTIDRYQLGRIGVAAPIAESVCYLNFRRDIWRWVPGLPVFRSSTCRLGDMNFDIETVLIPAGTPD